MENDKKTQNKPKSEKKPKSGKQIAKAILNTIINIMIVIVLIVSILIAVMALTSKASGVSTIFGHTIQTIQSPSMKGGSDIYEGGDFDEGDLIIGKAADANRKELYEVGDIVSYVGILSGTDQEGIICHRIIDVDESGAYTTKGDNNPDPDSTVHYNEQIKSVFYSKDYHGVVIKGFGKVIDFLQSQMGFFIVVLLPMIIFFLYELIRVVLNFSNYKKAKAEDEHKGDVEAAVAAALAERDKQEQLANEKTNDSTPASPADMTPEQMEQFKKFLELQKEQEKSEETVSLDPEKEPDNKE